MKRKRTASLDLIEFEIEKAETVLSEIDMELIQEHPSYRKLKKLASALIQHSNQIEKGIKRDKRFFKS